MNLIDFLKALDGHLIFKMNGNEYRVSDFLFQIENSDLIVTKVSV